jgi:hypothetical protein
MRTFAYDASGSFRVWLKTLTHHAWHDSVQGRHRARAVRKSCADGTRSRRGKTCSNAWRQNSIARCCIKPSSG